MTRCGGSATRSAGRASNRPSRSREHGSVGMVSQDQAPDRQPRKYDGETDPADPIHPIRRIRALSSGQDPGPDRHNQGEEDQQGAAEYEQVEAGEIGYARHQPVDHEPIVLADMSPEEIAEEWILEFREGIEGTGLRPGFIKMSVNKSVLQGSGYKLLHASCLQGPGKFTDACGESNRKGIFKVSASHPK